MTKSRDLHDQDGEIGQPEEEGEQDEDELGEQVAVGDHAHELVDHGELHVGLLPLLVQLADVLALPHQLVPGLLHDLPRRVEVALEGHVLVLEFLEQLVVLLLASTASCRLLYQVVPLQTKLDVLEPLPEFVLFLSIPLQLLPDVCAVEPAIGHESLLYLGDGLVEFFEFGVELVESLLGGLPLDGVQLAPGEVVGLLETYLLS